MRVFSDYDLSTLKPEYDNFEDRTVRNLLRLQSDLILKPSDFTVDLPTYLDLKILPQTNMIENLDDRIDSLDDQMTGVADLTSKGYELINQTIKIESSYEYSPGNFQADYGNYTFTNGTYTANDIMQSIGSFTKIVMNQIYGEKGYIILEEDIEFNLERFKIGLTLDKLTHIGFEIQLNQCPTIMEIFGLPSTSETVTVVVGSVLRVVFMDNMEEGLNLSANSYPKLDDRIRVTQGKQPNRDGA